MGESVGQSSPSTEVADTDILQADLVIEYPFNRTTGPVIGAFYTALREGQVIGIRGADGKVICPPVEYDPITSAPLTELVGVGTEGEVVSWSWVPNAREGQLLDHAHALALVKLDGADTAMLHVVDARSAAAMSTGARVQVRWAEERTGAISDIACFELAGTGSDS